MMNENTEMKLEEKEIIENEEEIEDKEAFGAKVEDGKIIITESENKDDIITIKSCPGVNLFINGEISDQITPVTSKIKLNINLKKLNQ